MPGRKKESSIEGANLLFRSAGRLKTIKRTGWLRKVGIEHCESVADHSYRMAIVGAYLAEEYKMDSGKVARMCLLHDLGESELGDKMPEEKVSEVKHRIEEDRVVRKILQELPDRARKRLLADWRELISNRSSEAKLVWQVDKLEMGLQQLDYIKQGFNKRKLSQFRPRGLTEELTKILDLYDP